MRFIFYFMKSLVNKIEVILFVQEIMIILIHAKMKTKSNRYNTDNISVQKNCGTKTVKFKKQYLILVLVLPFLHLML